MQNLFVSSSRHQSLSHFTLTLAFALALVAPSFAQEESEAATADTAVTEVVEDVVSEDATAEDIVAEDTVAEGEVAEEATEASEEESSDEAVAETESEPAAEEPATEESTSEETSTVEESTEVADAANPDAAAGSTSLQTVLLTLAVIILPIVLGGYIAKQVRQPELGWRISTILVALALATLAVTTGQFKGGPDLAGGVILIYEADKSVAAQPGAEEDEEGNTPANSNSSAPKITEEVISAIKQRVDPTSTREVSIRGFGDTMEIIIPKAGPDELEYTKRKISETGNLEFRITADPRWEKDRDIIEKALLLSPSQKLVMIANRPRAEWIAFDERQFSFEDPRLVQRSAGKRREALVLLDQYNVTGEYLASADKDIDPQTGGPMVSFTLDAKGGRRFERLTGDNLPNPTTQAKRQLGIVLDKKLISSPYVNSTIKNRGQITVGGDEAEVEFLVDILNAGSLPLTLNKTPISEETISPTIGLATVEKGSKAIAISLGAVLIFILLYYRFAGFVACFALLGTILLVLGAMVSIQAAFTLPGLAGLVLTVGMSVDANVLIFERIREELKKGASLRMAISNGFDRATTTIVDANLTTLITGVVLYSIGTDQIRGFAVTLVLGIIMSMFTAIFCSRVIFDIAERRRIIKSLNFSSIIGKTEIDFIGKRHVAALFSIILIGIGLAATYNRGQDLLNIDFTGGTSVTMVLQEPESINNVRAVLEETELVDKNLLVVARGESGGRYTINSSVEEVIDAEAIIAEAFAGKLQQYDMAVGTPAPFEEKNAEDEVSYTGTEIELKFNQSEVFTDNDGLAHDPLIERIKAILAEQGHQGSFPQLINDDYLEGSSQLFREWKLRLGLEEAQAVAVAEALQTQFAGKPVFPLANKIGSRIAGDLQEKAISAILVSLLGIVAYLWFRFQNIAFGLSAVVALIHDVLVTLGVIALSAYVANNVPALASALQIDAFQISLPIVAAFITIIGYSLNDTIVVFDRIREVRGKSPDIKDWMVNTSINQTLSRTLLTSLTTLIVVLILYFMGGAGIHGFAFSLVIGVLVGTYSSIFVASPSLLWMTAHGFGSEEDDEDEE